MITNNKKKWKDLICIKKNVVRLLSLNIKIKETLKFFDLYFYEETIINSILFEYKLSGVKRDKKLVTKETERLVHEILDNSRLNGSYRLLYSFIFNFEDGLHVTNLFFIDFLKKIIRTYES